MSKKIELRLYENKKFGTTFGKGKYHDAIFNATLDVLDIDTKYLLDFYDFDRWQHTAKTDEDMEVLDIVTNQRSKNSLVSWVLRYDPTTKDKNRVSGFALVNPVTNDTLLVVVDDERNYQESAKFKLKACKQVKGKNVATLWYTNVDSHQSLT